MTRRQNIVGQGSDFEFEVNPGADWEPVKPILLLFLLLY